MSPSQTEILSKVPAATAAFWLVKILATTVGEVGGNLLSMDWNLGYLEATVEYGLRHPELGSDFRAFLGRLER